jgi:OmpA-OmpF porin, OOP family
MKRNNNILKALFSGLFLIILCLKGYSQINGEHYVYDHDTTILASDSNLYEVENLGANINSSHVESGPRVSPDGKSLYFFRVNHPKNLAGTEDIWVSHYVSKDSSWTKAERMKEPINSYGQDAVHWISRDGKTMLLHNKYYKNGTVGNGVSITYKGKEGWTFPKALKIKGYKNQAICSFFLNDDMSTLLMCVEQKKNTTGKQDLYVAFKKGESGRKFSKPENLGPILNTAGVEATVWMNHKEDTIYFSSNGQKNTVGGMDVYRAIRTDKSNWTSWNKPVNLGTPYNTPDDEYYFSIPDEGDYIYMAHHFEHLHSDSVGQAHSDIVRIRIKELFIEPYLVVRGRLFDDWTKDTIPGIVTFKIFESGKIVAQDTTVKNIDEYYAKLPGQEKYSYTGISTLDGYIPEEGILDVTNLTKGIQEKRLDIYLKRKPAVKICGKIYDEVTKDSLNGELFVTYKDSDSILMRVPSDSLGGYCITLEAGKKYEIKSTSFGYISKVQTFDFTPIKEYTEKENDVYLLQLKEGIGFTIKNIFFDVDKAVLLPKSFPELDNLVKVMEEYPYITVEIQGHTDWDGSNEHNIDLSQRRAQAVVNYLTQQGIPAHQFVAKGYGEEKPIDTNATFEGRQNNRRVQFVILKINKPQ